MAMNPDRWVLLIVWVVCLPALFLGVASVRWREMAFVFLCNQSYTWTMSLLLVESGHVSNPVREFARASGCNFTFNFILYPTVAVFYCLYAPKGTWRNALHLGLYVAGLALFMWAMGEYTRLVDMRHMGWPLRLFVVGSGLITVRIGHMWYFGRGPFAVKGGEARAGVAGYDSPDGV